MWRMATNNKDGEMRLAAPFCCFEHSMTAQNGGRTQPEELEVHPCTHHEHSKFPSLYPLKQRPVEFIISHSAGDTTSHLSKLSSNTNEV